jgi:hypothetical protein
LDFYRPWEDYPRKGSVHAEAVFIGHYEPGPRIACIEAAAEAGLPLRVFSNEAQWKGKLSAKAAAMAGPGPGIYGEAYRERLSRAAISVCFLSRWNRDVYTKRVFEITACGGFLLCERSPLMKELFREGREAEYFDGPLEFVDKLHYYLGNPRARDKVARAGLNRVKSGGQSIHSRLKQWAADARRWRKELGR